MRSLLVTVLVLGCAHSDPTHALVTVTDHPSGDRLVLWDDGQVDVTVQRASRSFQLPKPEFERARKILLAQDLLHIRTPQGATTDGSGLYFQLRDGSYVHAFSVGGLCRAPHRPSTPEALLEACHLIEELERDPRSR